MSMIDGEVPSIKSGSGDPTRSLPSYLAKLSPRQLEAATHPPEHSLQILAGPGSGKTRVLTSRVAWLILDLNNRLRPEDVVVVTFTNKAANEMKQRLNSLIGKDRTASLVIGEPNLPASLLLCFCSDCASDMLTRTLLFLLCQAPFTQHVPSTSASTVT